MKNFDVFSIDPEEARELLHKYYNQINDYRWRWNDAENTGISIEVLNDFARTGQLEIRYIPILYKGVFGDKSLEEASLHLKKLERRVENG